MTRPGLRRAAATVALSLPLALTAVVAGAEAAAAHAIPIATSPQDGAVIAKAPTRVSVTFDEAVDKPAYLTVTGPAGRVDTGAAVIKGAVISVGLRPGIPAGAYTVGYRVVSDDGHPVAGGFAFQLAGAGAASPTTSATTGQLPAPASPGAGQASVRAAAQAATPTQPSGRGEGHWVAAAAGVAVVIVGLLALLWERLRRRPSDDQATP